LSTVARTGLLAAARPEEAAAALAARQGRQDHPRLRPDLVIRRQVRMGEVTWVVKDPLPALGNYVTFTDPEWTIIALFDGTRTRAGIGEEYNRQTGAGVDLSFVMEWEEELRRFDLIEQSAGERNLELLKKFKTARQRAADAKAEGFNPFFIQFSIVDPDRFLNRTVRFVRWIWSPPVVLLWCVAAAWTVGVFSQNFQPLWSGTVELYAFLGKPLLDVLQFFFILSFIGGIHELGHAYSCKMYGGEVHDIGIALLYFTPAFYCDTTDAILFTNKWHRFWVTVAGIYIEGFLCSAATALWVVSYPDTLLHELAFKTMLFTGVSTVFFNINPLMKIDGYHALTSVLELPELREDSFRYIGAWFQNRVLRLPVDVPVLSRRRKRIYWIYGLLALSYVTVIMRFVAGLFFNFYSRYFPDFAIVLLVLTLYRIFRKRVRLFTRTAKLFYLDKKDFIMAPNTRRPLVVVAVLVALLLVLPWTRRTIRAPIVLQPLTEIRLEAPENATVTEVLAGEGDLLRAGQPIVRLVSAGAAADRAVHRVEKDRFAMAARSAREASDPALAYEADRRSASLDEALESDAARTERLVLRSPIGGRLLTPRLGDLRGTTLAAGTLIAEVGDTRTLRANLAVSERLLEYLAPGEAVVAIFPGRPLAAAHGVIQSISAATLDQSRTATAHEPAAPSAIPDKFTAVAVFDNRDGSLVPGMTGSAKIYARRASYVSRAWAILRRWVQTIFW
jgi:putative peptide zinc metalloprotease protein